MTRAELLELIDGVQRHRSEMTAVEVKTAQGGTPKHLYEPLSAFSNRHDGGVILFGLDEDRDFRIVGVGNVHRLQEEVSNVAVAEMEPSLRPEFTVEEIDGKMVVAVEVPEIPMERKPCYYKTAGLQNGSHIRVGNTNRRMNDYEIFGYVSARIQPRFDEEPVTEATLDDLDTESLESYVTLLRRTRTQATYLNQPFHEILKQRRIVREVEGVLRPTFAGLLVFGKYPQMHEPQMVITFLQFYGTTETEKTPRGERFLDNRKFEGRISEMMEAAINTILSNIRKSSLIEGVFRRDIPEYPEEAIREAVANAVAHRDYSHHVRGNYIQLRLFADRLEVQSPGGLYGNVTEETLEDEQTTRNRLLMQFLEDLHIVENRKSGIRAMIQAMRSANLEPPRFQDKRSSFRVTFRNHTLMSPATIDWLNQFSDRLMNDAQRMALVYLRHNPQITNSDYRRLNNVNRDTAYAELKALVRLDLVQQRGTGRWASYTLNVSPERTTLPPQTHQERILAYVREHGSINNTKARELLNINIYRASRLFSKMVKLGLLEREGESRQTRYRLS